MNAADAFSFSCAGAIDEGRMRQYAGYVQMNFDNVKGMGGWLAKEAEKTLDRFSNFMNSRAWELSKILTGNGDGEYVGRFDIGYLGSLNAQQQAQGFMRDYIMANPLVMQMYLDGGLEGYGGDFSQFCNSVGKNNVFYRNATHGIVQTETKDDVQKTWFSHFGDVPGTGMSFREQADIMRTWKATNHLIGSQLFDMTSPSNKKMNEDNEEET